MPNNSGVFSLSTYYNKDLSGDIPNRNRESYREYGYFGGTLGASRLDRIDYSNDTSTGIFRKTIRVYGGATGNSNFGYFGGGYGPLSTVDRVNYSNDTAVEGLRGPLSLARWRFSATGNSNFGYFCGGAKQNVENIVSTVDRINYSNDLATASVRGPLSLPKGFAGSSGNSNFGYYYGGSDGGVPAVYTNIERINYSNDTTKLSVRGLLVSGSGGDSATGNNNFGYIVTYPSSRVHRIDYSNDLSTSVHRAITNYIFAGRGATGNSNFGYFGGGYNPYSVVERLDYSNDNTQTSLRGPLSYSRIVMSATSSSSFGGSPISQYGVFAKPFGYFLGSVSSIDRIDYSNDTANGLIKGYLTIARGQLATTGNFDYGYAGGGYPATSTVDRINYSNDSNNTLLRGPLSLARESLSATGNSSFGYFLSGDVFPVVFYTTIDRINYSNDSATALVRGSLADGVRLGAAASSDNYGYFVGGSNPDNDYKTYVRRIDYSNDTATSVYRGNLLIASSHSGSSGSRNPNYGYFVTGRTNPVVTSRSNVQRIDYANDTTSSSTRGPLTANGNGASGTGNSNFGYFAIGSTVNRIDYTDDLSTASIRGPLSSSKGYCGSYSPTAFGGATDFQATSTFFDIQSMRKIEDTTNYSVKKRALGSYGYFGGGVTPAEFGGVSAVDRIDYSNDTQIARYRTNLSVGRRTLSSTSNFNFGYFYGGENPAVQTLIDRIDYSNDSSTAVFRSYITSRPGGRLAAGGNNNFAYNGSGFVSFIDRTDYSNDLTNASRRGNLISTKNASSFVGNNNFGYIVSGELVGNGSTLLSRVDRIDYSNDNSNASVRGPLTLARWFFSGTGNSNFGYVGGGGTLGVVSSVERINYSTDTSTALVRGPLSSSRYALAATGNSNYGWFGGGGTPAVISTIDRIDFSNDTPTASVRGPLSIQRSTNTATTNARSS